MTGQRDTSSPRLSEISPALERLLNYDQLPPAAFELSEIAIETAHVAMRDGVKLATEIMRPPITSGPVIAVRTPYGRTADGNAGAYISLARRGYIVVTQDCRGTGASEPESWDFYIFEQADGYDFVEWITQQPWFSGFIGSCGGSYVGQTQWSMALHPAMSAIIPQVSGLGVAAHSANLFMFLNAYSRTVGKGLAKANIPFFEIERHVLKETLSSGYFNDPIWTEFPSSLTDKYPETKSLNLQSAQRAMWERYCGLEPSERATLLKDLLQVDCVTASDMQRLPPIFGHRIGIDAYSIPHPNPEVLAKMLHGSQLMITGWYDWCLNDALATWSLLSERDRSSTWSRARLIIGPNAHNMPGYREGAEHHPELLRSPLAANQVGLLLHWYETLREGTVSEWPNVIYYLMGAQEWRTADSWPPQGAQKLKLYLRNEGRLCSEPADGPCTPATFKYDPANPTPTIGGSIVSYVYPVGSVDISKVQERNDILVYTTPCLERDLDVVGPLRLILFASSSASDTDFFGRLSDVFPDGRAVQLQSGGLRARYREDSGSTKPLESGSIYELEIDMCATANRFKAGHSIRLDISSSDFPKFDRNANCGGCPGEPVSALQTIYQDVDYPSHLELWALAPDDALGTEQSGASEVSSQ